MSARLLILSGFLLLISSSALARKYTVKSGDNLGKIAIKYKCSVDEIMRKNRMARESIRVGQTLKIPRCRKGRPSTGLRRMYVVGRGDTVLKIAKRFDCSTKQIKRANSMKGNGLRVGKKIAIPYCKGKVGHINVSKGGGGSKGRATKGRTRKRLKNGRHRMNTTALGKLLSAHGFHRPRSFLAFVIEVTLNKSQQRVQRERSFSFQQTAFNQGWNPASTIKLFSAIGALERTKAKGFKPSVTATFYDPGRPPRSYRVSQLVSDSLVKSNNIAHNRLVQLTGWDWLNRRVISRRGMKKTAIHKPYEKSVWVPLTGSSHFKNSPKVKLHHGGRVRTLPARKGSGKYTCMGSSACSTMHDLAHTMRRLMLHEQLPGSKRYNLGRRELQIIRSSLKQSRHRGMQVVNGIGAGLDGKKAVMFHKPGFSEGWMSDVVYVMKAGSRKRYIVAMASSGGREALNSAARAIGEIIANDEFEFY